MAGCRAERSALPPASSETDPLTSKEGMKTSAPSPLFYLLKILTLFRALAINEGSPIRYTGIELNSCYF